MLVVGLAGTLACSEDKNDGNSADARGGSASGAAGSATAGAAAAGKGGAGGTGTSGSGGTGTVIPIGGSPSHAGSSSASGSGGTSGSAGNGGDGSPLFCYAQDTDVCLCTFDEMNTLPATVFVCGGFDDRYCCADPSFPQSGTCACSEWGCVEHDGYCECNSFPGALFPDEPSTLSCDPSFTTCCMTPGNPYACYCLNGSCPDGTEQVPSCELDGVSCERDQVIVPSCN